MFLIQELWLIVVGLIVARVVQKTNGTPLPYRRLAFWAAVSSLFMGWFGMITQWFFPSDVLGLALCSAAALVTCKIVIGDQTKAQTTTTPRSPRSSRSPR